jgi:hypothetical protein
VPWEKIWGTEEPPWEGEIPNDWLLAMGVIYGELQGGKFNWKSGKYETPK